MKTGDKHMKKIELLKNKYSLIENYKEGFIQKNVEDLITDYFADYDYILGDWAYNKLRLKGFCDKENSLFNKHNDYSKIHDYITNNCAFECKYFILKKEKTND